MTVNNCFIKLEENTLIKTRLFLFPFAGGTSQSYRSLIKSGSLAPCNISALELPGRGIRMRDLLTSDIAMIKAECFESIKPYVNQPLVLFGHSMGAILAFELLCELEANYPELNAALVVSAANSPKHVALKHDFSRMPNEEFKNVLNSMGGIPTAISENEALIEFFLPRIRNDFSLIQQYKNHKNIRLKSSIKVIAATDDDNLTREGITSWESYTQSSFQLNWCSGGHFYIEKNMTLLSDTLNQAISEVGNE